MTFQVAPVVKNLPANAGDARDMGSVSGRERSPGVDNGNQVQFSSWKFHGQESGSLQAIVHGVAQSQT